MNFTKVSFLIATLLASTALIHGQQSPSANTSPVQNPQKPAPDRSINGRIVPIPRVGDDSDKYPSAQIYVSGDPIIYLMQRQLEIEKIVSVPKAVSNQHSLFLKTPNSGIFKLLPAEQTNIFAANGGQDPKKEIPRDCSFYSFYSKQHERQYADIRFIDGKLRVKAVSDSFGVLVPLKANSLNSIEANTPEVVTLIGSPIPKKIKPVISIADVVSTEAETTPGSIYLLRTAHNKKYDLAVAFQVVGKDEEGGIIVIWKRLYKGKAPKFKS